MEIVGNRTMLLRYMHVIQMTLASPACIETSVFVSGFAKSVSNHRFGISKNTNLKYLSHCASLQPH